MTELNIDRLDSTRPRSRSANIASAGQELRPASLFSENGLAHFNALQRAGVKRQNKDPHMPWLANTFWQLLLSLVLFCCKHC
jgi:hypothetical protein